MSDDGPDAAWFVYERRAGRLTARPVNAAGWVVLTVAGLFPAVVMLLAGPTLAVLHPLLLIGVMLSVLFVTLGIVFALVLRWGRPAKLDRPPDPMR